MNHNLSQREMEVLQSIIHKGHDKTRIVEEFSISEHTLKAHLCRIYSKLYVTNLTDAVVKAIRHGIVPVGGNRLEGMEE